MSQSVFTNKHTSTILYLSVHVAFKDIPVINPYAHFDEISSLSCAFLRRRSLQIPLSEKSTVSGINVKP